MAENVLPGVACSGAESNDGRHTLLHSSYNFRSKAAVPGALAHNGGSYIMDRPASTKNCTGQSKSG